MYKELKAFKEREGHVTVPFASMRPLSQWLSRQRRHYKNARDGIGEEKHQLSAERIGKLEIMGVVWNYQVKRFHEAWENKFSELNLCVNR